MKPKGGGRLVWSSDRPVETKSDAPAPPARDPWRSLPPAEQGLCGGGGGLKLSKTAAGDPCFEVEVQGDHAEKLVAELVKAGYKAKRAGG